MKYPGQTSQSFYKKNYDINPDCVAFAVIVETSASAHTWTKKNHQVNY